MQKHGNDVPVCYNLVTTCVQGCNKVVVHFAYIVCTSAPAYAPLLSYMYMYNGGFHFGIITVYICTLYYTYNVHTPYIHTYIHIYIHIHTYIHTYIHVHTYMYIHTYIHIYLHPNMMLR